MYFIRYVTTYIVPHSTCSESGDIDYKSRVGLLTRAGLELV